MSVDEKLHERRGNDNNLSDTLANETVDLNRADFSQSKGINLNHAIKVSYLVVLAAGTILWYKGCTHDYSNNNTNNSSQNNARGIVAQDTVNNQESKLDTAFVLKEKYTK